MRRQPLPPDVFPENFEDWETYSGKEDGRSGREDVTASMSEMVGSFGSGDIEGRIKRAIYPKKCRLQAYRNILTTDTTIVLHPDSGLLRYLRGPEGQM